MRSDRLDSLRYVAPFGIFLAALGVLQWSHLSDLAAQIVLIGLSALALLLVSRPIIDLRIERWAGSLLIGIIAFAVWIVPDLLIPGYRRYWPFDNSLVGSVHSSLSAGTLTSPLILGLRTVRAVLIVPLIEELFWRAWLMRWIISPKFEAVPLGTYARNSFWLVAILFASEHGPYWDVGLAVGVLYNWWMLKTGRLGDLVLAHAITNACLSAYVVVAGRWEYWL